MGKDTGDPEMTRHGLCPQRASSLVLATDSWATSIQPPALDGAFLAQNVTLETPEMLEVRATFTVLDSEPRAPPALLGQPCHMAPSTLLSRHMVVREAGTRALLELIFKRRQKGIEPNETGSHSTYL